MAEYGEWNRKGATLSDVTARAEYGVSREFIVQGIQSGRLEYRDGASSGSPYLRLLRGQFEEYIADKLGAGYLQRVRRESDLRGVKKEIASLKRKLRILEERKAALEG